MSAAPAKKFVPPRAEARQTEVPGVEEVPRGLDGLVHDAIGRWRSRASESRRLWKLSGVLEAEVDGLRKCSERHLRSLMRKQREAVRRRGAAWSKELPACLPLVAEAARRTVGLRAYRTQIMGALAIGEGFLAEMATGEGKTLTIALAAAVAGWTGRPCHVVTANDYLAQRDSEQFSLFFNLCGLQAASVTATIEGADRRERYRADVVYCTGKELVADFLRDQILLGPMADSTRRAGARLAGGVRQIPTVLRGLHTAIVDEADNQLIDEAVTPLIISRKEDNEVLREACAEAEKCAASLLPGEHYELNERHKEVRLLPAGRDHLSAWCANRKGFLSATDWMADLITQSLQARHFFLRDKQYVMVDGKVVIVDEFTGRPMPGRSWRLGLHQAVEAKEEAELSSPSETLARLSFQKFYRLFPHLAGITGTARESAREFWRIYNLPMVEVPRHRPNLRVDNKTAFFFEEDRKWETIATEIARIHATGRPVLVGTRSVAASEHLARILSQRGLVFSLLNAVRNNHEAGIIAQAGEKGAITIATNMAGRGTDITINNKVRELGGVHVVLTEAHESRRIDRQLRGRSGRQGDPGSTRLFLSYEDELLQRFLGPVSSGFVRNWCGIGLPFATAVLRGAGWWAQYRAEKKSRRQRFLVMRQDAEMVKSIIGGGPRQF